MERELRIGQNTTVPSVDLVFRGDHQYHHVDLGDDVTMSWRPDSLVLEIHSDGPRADQLLLTLLGIVPQLRQDRP